MKKNREYADTEEHFIETLSIILDKDLYWNWSCYTVERRGRRVNTYLHVVYMGINYDVP